MKDLEQTEDLIVTSESIRQAAQGNMLMDKVVEERSRFRSLVLSCAATMYGAIIALGRNSGMDRICSCMIGVGLLLLSLCILSVLACVFLEAEQSGDLYLKNKRHSLNVSRAKGLEPVITTVTPQPLFLFLERINPWLIGTTVIALDVYVVYYWILS